MSADAPGCRIDIGNENSEYRFSSNSRRTCEDSDLQFVRR